MRVCGVCRVVVAFDGYRGGSVGNVLRDARTQPVGCCCDGGKGVERIYSISVVVGVLVKSAQVATAHFQRCEP